MPLSASLRAALERNTPALGGAPLGNLFHAIDDDVAANVVAAAWDTGVRYFDTAPHYGHGRSELRVGAALRDRPRDAYVLSTKVGRVLEPDAHAARDQHGYADTLPFVQRHDYGGDGIRRSLDDSRRRLGLERIDLVYVHDCDAATLGEDFERHWQDLLRSGFPTLARMTSDGDIAGWGIGVNGVDICMQVLDFAKPDVILLAGRYTLADQQALPRLLPRCVERGVTVVLGGPFNSGILATGARDGATFFYVEADAEIKERTRRIEAVCARHGVALAAAAIQFPLHHPAVATVVAGMRSAEEAKSNLAHCSADVPGQFWDELKTLGLIDRAAPTR